MAYAGQPAILKGTGNGNSEALNVEIAFATSTTTTHSSVNLLDTDGIYQRALVYGKLMLR
jgi:hypothetical protein